MNIRIKQLIDFYLGSVLIFSLRPIVYVVGKILNKNHSLEVRGDIVFLKFVGGGSLVIAFPSLLGIRKRYPNSKLILVTTSAVKPFAELLGIFDQIRVINDKNILVLAFSALVVWVQCLFVDTVIDFEVYSKLSTVFSLCTLARNRIGFFMENIFWRKHINTHLVYFNRSSGIYSFYEQLSYLIHAIPEKAEVCREYLFARVSQVAKPLEADKKISIGFSCSDFGRERMLSVSQWHSYFTQRLKSDEVIHFYFLGTHDDQLFAKELIQILKASFPQCKFENCAGQFTLKETVSILWSSHEFWGIDSGLLHFARIGGIKTVSFWGPTDPQTRLKPFEYLSEEIFYEKIPCSPCIHVADIPPCLGQNKCIEKLFDSQLKVGSRDLLFTSWPHGKISETDN